MCYKRTAHKVDGPPKRLRFLQVHKMDGTLKGDITATKWTDDHNDKRTAHKVEGPPTRLKFFQVHKMDGILEVI